MGIFYRYAGNMPALYLEKGAANPAAVARAIKADMEHHIKSRKLPALAVPDSRNSFLSLGMAGRREWLFNEGGSKARRKRIGVLHWPTLIGDVLRVQMLSPCVPLLLWLLRDALARRSALLVDLLQRKFPWEYQKFLDVEVVGMPEPLTHVEESLVSLYLKLAATDQAVISAFKYSYDETFSLLTTNKSVSDLAGDFGLNKNEISTFYLDRMPTISAALPKEPKYGGLIHPTFVPTQLRTPLRELIVAWHARLPHDHIHFDDLVKEIGVIYNAEDQMLIINFRRFYPYRKKTSDVLTNFLPRDLRTGDVPLEVQGRNLVRLFEERYPSLVPSAGVGTYRDIYYGEGTLWDYNEWDESLFVDVKAYKKLVLKARTTELGRLGVHVPKRRLQSQARHMIETRKPSGFVEYYINPTNDEKVKFYLIALGNKVYFSPPWEVPEYERYREVRTYKQSSAMRRIREDVKYVKTLRLWFYTFDFLIRQRGAPVGAIPGLRDWLLGWSKMETSYFRKLAKRKVEIYNRSEFRAKKESLQGVRFTPEEDSAIQQYYRPKMDFAAEKALFEACGGRKPQAISNRARFLCDQLLAEGIYDIKKLPHKRYNSNLVKRIKDAAVRNGDDPEKVISNA